MEKKNHLDEKAFLRYFFCSYIPPFTSLSIPKGEEAFKDIYLSAVTVWDGLNRHFDRYAFSDKLKLELVKLFELCDALWEEYLVVTTDDLRMGDRAFNKWSSAFEIQKRWSEIRTLAKEIEREGKLYSSTS